MSSITLLEMTYPEIVSRASKGTLGRKIQVKGQRIESFFNKVDKNGDLYFFSTSQTTPPFRWMQILRFSSIYLSRTPLSFRNITHFKEFLMHDDVIVWCTCPMYKYFMQYTATQRGYSRIAEKRPSPIRNPHGEGSVCKHLYRVLTVLPFHTSEIVRDMRKRGILSKS